MDYAVILNHLSPEGCWDYGATRNHISPEGGLDYETVVGQPGARRHKSPWGRIWTTVGQCVRRGCVFAFQDRRNPKIQIETGVSFLFKISIRFGMRVVVGFGGGGRWGKGGGREEGGWDAGGRVGAGYFCKQLLCLMKLLHQVPISPGLLAFA